MTSEYTASPLLCVEKVKMLARCLGKPLALDEDTGETADCRLHNRKKRNCNVSDARQPHLLFLCVCVCVLMPHVCTSAHLGATLSWFQAVTLPEACSLSLSLSGLYCIHYPARARPESNDFILSWQLCMGIYVFYIITINVRGRGRLRHKGLRVLCIRSKIAQFFNVHYQHFRKHIYGD